jgi:2-polyprenyl-6-methoxyphenol hydroxylase-like FAD-dependent oxidoreductase
MAQRPRVAIVGGGIGGLFAANALQAHDIPAAVYEQAPAIGEVGAGVFLTPNSVRHLQRVGLGPAVENPARASVRSPATSATMARRSRQCR